MHGIGGDVLSAGLCIEFEVLSQQVFMLFRPWLHLKVPRHDPRVLPEVEPKLPVARPRKRHWLYVDFY
jgi:hypothetical protein